jgi:hypothetical protein
MRWALSTSDMITRSTAFEDCDSKLNKSKIASLCLTVNNQLSNKQWKKLNMANLFLNKCWNHHVLTHTLQQIKRNSHVTFKLEIKFWSKDSKEYFNLQWEPSADFAEFCGFTYKFWRRTVYMKTNRSFNILQYMIYLSVSNKAQKISYRTPGILAL